MSNCQFREILHPDWTEKCARHTSPHTARTQQFGFYCDVCAERLTKEVFNGRAPLFHGETVTGFCGLCNLEREVTIRSWFVCTICWGVVLAYHKSLVSSSAVLKFWADEVQSYFPSLDLRETEPIRLEPYKQAKKSKRESAKELSVLDFIVSDLSSSDSKELFHIELKTGPGSVEQMEQFQLDVNDYEDILGVAANTRLPVFLFHSQVSQRYVNGTRRIVPEGLWWTDISTLRASLIRVGKRRGEDKFAGYFRPDAFRRMSDFPTVLATESHDEYVQLLLSGSLALPGRG